MATKLNIQRDADIVHVSFQVTLEPGTSMLDREEQILEALNEAGKQVTGEALRDFDTDGSPIIVGGRKLTSKGKVGKDYETPYGKSMVERHVYQSSEGGETFCPLDEHARIIESSTPRFAKMCSSKYTLTNSTVAKTDLLENHGRKVSRCYLQDITDAVSVIAGAKEVQWKYADPKLPESVATVAVGIDGTCMLYCEEGFRQAMVGTISLYNAAGERLHTVYIGSAPEYGKERFLRLMEEEVAVYKTRYDTALWVGIADGAHDNWKWLEQWTDLLILDFWHAAGYLEKIGQVMRSPNKDPTDWFQENRERLKMEAGAAEKLLRRMKWVLTHCKPRGAKRKDLESAISYFENHKDKMDYAEYREECLPIGSGVTEAACKTVVKQRMCGSGMKWKHSGATTVLRLRSLILTEGRWQQFWKKVSRYGF